MPQRNELGHTQAQSTARYAHLADETTRRASNEVDGLFGSFLTMPEPEPRAYLRLVSDAETENR